MYYLTEFNGVDLPEYNPFTQAGTRPLIAPIATMADGRAFDRLGSLQARQGGGTVQYIASYYDDQAHRVESDYYTLLEQIGEPGWLVRRRDPTGTLERIYARLLNVDYTHTPQWGGRAAQNIRLTFFMADSTWNGMRYGDFEPAYGAMVDMSSSAFRGVGAMPIQAAVTKAVSSGSTTTVTLVNGGNATQYGVYIRAYANALTTLTGGFYISYQATGATGAPYYTIKHTADVGASLSQQVVIDTLAKTMTDNAISPAGEIANFEYGGTHTSEHWLGLHPGANTITIGTNTGTFPAGGVNFVFSYCEAWQ